MGILGKKSVEHGKYLPVCLLLDDGGDVFAEEPGARRFMDDFPVMTEQFFVCPNCVLFPDVIVQEKVDVTDVFGFIPGVEGEDF